MKSPGRRRRGRGATAARIVATAVITAVALIPVAVVVGRAVIVDDPGTGRPVVTLAPLAGALAGEGGTWFANSLTVAVATVIGVLAIGAPAGYVLSRARGRWVSGYAIVIFVAQSLPAIALTVPLFILLAGAGLVDSLAGVEIVYVGANAALAAWMCAAAIDDVPIELEEAAWLDGCTVATGFLRIVLRTALPGLVPVAVFVFLAAWNEYMIATVFLHSDHVFTLGIALIGFGSPALATVMLVPPVLLAVALAGFPRLGDVLAARRATPRLR